MHRIFDYVPPADDEQIALRILASVHRRLDEEFPHRDGASNRRFARTEFSMLGEDTIIDHRSSDVVPPPPKKQTKDEAPAMPPSVQPPVSGANAPVSAVSMQLPPLSAQDSDDPSLALPKSLGAGSAGQPLSGRTRSSVAKTGYSTSQVIGSASKSSFSVKLFLFLFAVLVGAVARAIFFFLKLY